MPIALLGLAPLLSFARPAGGQIPVYRAEPDPLVIEPAVAATPAPVAATPESAPAATPLPALPPARAEMISKPARASDLDYEDDETASEPAPRRGWYGWQTLIVDGASLSALVLGAGLSNGDGDAGGLVALGLLGYEFGPGIVHFVHRNPGRGFASMGLRLGMPLAGAFFGASAASNCDGFLCEAEGAAAGLLLGMAGAIALDAALFAYDEQPVKSPRMGWWVPRLAVTPRRAWIGIAGSL